MGNIGSSKASIDSSSLLLPHLAKRDYGAIDSSDSGAQPAQSLRRSHFDLKSITVDTFALIFSCCFLLYTIIIVPIQDIITEPIYGAVNKQLAIKPGRKRHRQIEGPPTKVARTIETFSTRRSRMKTTNLM
ncbi:hypothetical protein L596_015677 [Steinernema carpocapsae]|uniref:Uncharacterized protein n=1 Tax=Steinernema carpocapsae TaxID=34508 RepID=A0A4V6A381_STECR|nr:hypothetical protein L596_015677 [Steinernema carpocapsae]